MCRRGLARENAIPRGSLVLKDVVVPRLNYFVTCPVLFALRNVLLPCGVGPVGSRLVWLGGWLAGSVTLYGRTAICNAR